MEPASPIALAHPITAREPRFSSRALRWIWIFYTRRMTRAARLLLWPTVGFLAYTSASLDYQAFVPACYMLIVWIIALLVGMFYRPTVRLEVAHAQRTTAGESMTVNFEIEQLGRRPGLDLYISPQALPGEIRCNPEDGVMVPTLSPGQNARGRLDLLCQRRGVYRLGPWEVKTDFPFGVFCSVQSVATSRSFLVGPHFTPLARLEIPAGRRYQPGGIAMAAQMGDSAEFIGDREYRDGDNVRDIDWRATARLNIPIVREYKEEYFLRSAVILDTHVPPWPAGGDRACRSRRECLEHAISLAAAIGDHLAQREYIIDLFAAGPNLYHLVAGRGLAYQEQILDILACVDESPAEPFGEIQPELMHNIDRISSTICIFLDWNPVRKAFVEALRDQGVGLKVILVRDGPCSSPPDQELTILTPADCRTGVTEL
ncbi:MAG TPA: DUF58 domain-containing protein [Planctomycetota bacterium]|jgi:uncharacterized protein (DUF58 family)